MIRAMRRGSQAHGRRRRQGGAAAIEFAFVFPLLLLIVYATIVYGYVFFLQQTINLLAQESAKAAVAMTQTYDSSGNPVLPDYAGAVTSYYNSAVGSGLLSALPSAQVADIPVPTVSNPVDITDKNGNPVGQVITITAKFLNVNVLFPSLSLPGIGVNLPPLPVTLSAHASVRVS